MTNYDFKKKKDMVKLVRSLNKGLASYVTNNVEAEYESYPEVVCGPTPSYKFRAGLTELSQYQFRLSFRPTSQNQYELVLQVLKEDLEVGRMGSHTNSIDLSELCAKIINQDCLNREMNKGRGGPQEPYSYPGGW
ncbi:MAG: hypothetical protein Q8R47_01695 [Nanoarchaeota archaeon]|nr:hypothetical protein [Nanoarchaeota archaeon]